MKKIIFIFGTIMLIFVLACSNGKEADTTTVPDASDAGDETPNDDGSGKEYTVKYFASEKLLKYDVIVERLKTDLHLKY